MKVQLKVTTADTLTCFLGQLNAPASSFSALASTSFPSLADFNASSSSEALKWIDLVQDVVSQIVSTRTVTTQHCPQSIILSLQKADGSCCSACGMLAKELLQNPMAMVTSRLFVRPTGSKTSKIGRVYNSYQLLSC